MKKLKSILVMLLCCVSSSAEDFSVDGIYYNIVSSEDLVVEVTFRGDNPNSYSNEYTGNVVIPEKVTYNGKTYSVTSIGFFAFDNCSSLTSITLPNSLKSIGEYAFAGCTNIKDVNVPNLSVWCGIKFESNPLSYAQNLCVDGKPISDVVIPDDVTCIKKWTFASCKNLKSIKLHNKVSSIDSLAFYKCINLKTIEIPNSVTKIDIDAFSYCTSLTSVKLSENLTSIPDGLFYNCTSLSSINIPEGVASIGIYAFYGCSSLESIFMPESIIKIGECSFFQCNNVKKLTILAKTPPAIDSDAFSCWNAVLYVPNDVLGTYKSTSPWMYFETIKTGIVDITSLPVVVQNNGGAITVTGADDGTMVEVYGISGTKLGEAKTAFNTATIHTDAQAGSIVIVKVGNKSIKIRI
ncbi:MAG: leucine-rich repeat domain-containing protein [Prevotella sp.]|nr:leucine-rich repeat domain-containing protein [Prevotella sp.]